MVAYMFVSVASHISLDKMYIFGTILIMTTVPKRYKVGKPHEKLVADLRKQLSNTLVHYKEVDVVRLALEEFWKRANPKKELPRDVAMVHKIYYSDNEL